MLCCKHSKTFVLLICLLVVGCAPRIKPPAGTVVDPAVGEALISDWRMKSAEIFSVQGIARARIQSPERGTTLSQVVLAEQPDRFRAETLSPFGTPLLTLAANGERLGVLALNQNTFYQGAASLENLARFTRLPIKAADLVGLLLYKVPVFSGQSLVVQRDEGDWQVTVSLPDRRQELFFDSDRQLVAAHYYRDDQLFLKIGFARIGALVRDFPARFYVELPEFSISAELDFTELAINRTFLPGIFRLEPPAGVKVVDLDGPL